MDEQDGLDQGQQDGSDVQADLDDLTPLEREARKLLDEFEKEHLHKLTNWHLVAIERENQTEVIELQHAISTWAAVETNLHYSSDFIFDSDTELTYLMEGGFACAMRFRDPQVAMLVKLTWA